MASYSKTRARSVNLLHETSSSPFEQSSSTSPLKSLSAKLFTYKYSTKVVVVFFNHNEQQVNNSGFTVCLGADSCCVGLCSPLWPIGVQTAEALHPSPDHSSSVTCSSAGGCGGAFLTLGRSIMQSNHLHFRNFPSPKMFRFECSDECKIQSHTQCPYNRLIIIIHHIRKFFLKRVHKWTKLNTWTFSATVLGSN